jgi:membrane protease YdiL (CAAX protease family)
MPLDDNTPERLQFTEPDIRPSIDLREQEPPWTGWDVLLLAVATIVSIFVFSGIALGIATQFARFKLVSVTDLARDPRIIVPGQVAAYVVVIGLMALIVRRGYQHRFWRDIHWNFPHVNWLAYIVGGFVLALMIQFSSALLPIPKQLPIEKFFKDVTSAYIMGVFGITAAPLFEELFFRGFLFPVLARRLGVTFGIIITALLFALIHQSQLAYAWGPLLLLFIVGVVLTTVRARTNSVGASFLLHVAYNSTLFVLLWLSTDHFRHMEKAAAAILR